MLNFLKSKGKLIAIYISILAIDLNHYSREYYKLELISPWVL
jgi:hypothetical protein